MVPVMVGVNDTPNRRRSQRLELVLNVACQLRTVTRIDQKRFTLADDGTDSCLHLSGIWAGWVNSDAWGYALQVVEHD